MIKLLCNETEDVFLKALQFNRAFGCKIKAQYSAYGDQSPYADFWVMLNEEDKKPVAALSRRGDCVTICTNQNQNADIEELTSFITTIGGFHFISSDYDTCKEIVKQLAVDCCFTYGDIMVCNAVNTVGSNTIQITKAQEFKKVYECIAKSDEEFARCIDYDDFYVDISLKMRRDACFFYQTTQNNVVCSVAGAVNISDDCAIIGCVSTLPEFRGQGYATAVTSKLSQDLLKLSKKPILLAVDEDAKRLYQKIGFIEDGMWGDIELQ